MVSTKTTRSRLTWHLIVRTHQLAVRTVALLAAVLTLTPPAQSALADLEIEKIAELDDPVFLTHAGDDRLYVVRLFGEIVVLQDGAFLPEPFLDIRDRVGRIFSIAFHPDYATNGFFFVHRVEKETLDSIVTRFHVPPESPLRADPSSEVVLIRIPKPLNLYYGGQLAFGPDGFLYVSTGQATVLDPGGMVVIDPECSTQSIDRLEGKILRLDVDRNVDVAPYFAPPPDNPFVATGRPEIWSLGLRSPWRFSFDRESGYLFIADVGENDREEVNYQPADDPGGANYGWKIMEGSSCFGDTSGCAAPVACGDAALTLPALEYRHLGGNCAAIGGVVYRGSLVPDLYGLYLYADFCTGTIWAAEQKDGSWAHRELSVTLPGVVTITEDTAGEIYLTAAGGIYRLIDPTLPAAGVVEFEAPTASVSEAAAEALVAVRRLGGSSGAVGVDVVRTGGTATAEEFPLTTATLEWADGETGTKAVAVPLADDAQDEADETAVVELRSIVGGARLGGRKTSRLVIVDDDEPSCIADATHLCLNGERFRVSVTWRTANGETGSGQAVIQGADDGSFWFFSPNNPEIFVKVLDACFAPFDHFWVFAAGLTDVATELVVVDTATGMTRRYSRPLGASYAPVTDTSAFPTCP